MKSLSFVLPIRIVLLNICSPLTIAGLPGEQPGPMQVIVNGTTTTFDWPAQPTGRQ